MVSLYIAVGLGGWVMVYLFFWGDRLLGGGFYLVLFLSLSLPLFLSLGGLSVLFVPISLFLYIANVRLLGGGLALLGLAWPGLVWCALVWCSGLPSLVWSGLPCSLCSALLCFCLLLQSRPYHTKPDH